MTTMGSNFNIFQPRASLHLNIITEEEDDDAADDDAAAAAADDDDDDGDDETMTTLAMTTSTTTIVISWTVEVASLSLWRTLRRCFRGQLYTPGRTAQGTVLVAYVLSSGRGYLALKRPQPGFLSAPLVRKASGSMVHPTLEIWLACSFVDIGEQFPARMLLC